MLRSAVLILSGNAASALLLLARNLVVARLIPVADYGVAATFAMVMAVVEMTSSFGLQQQIVQAKEGDDPRFQAVLQGFQLARGVASGLVLFLLAGPLARLMGIPPGDQAGVVGAYQWLALVPVLNAAQHFDIHRLNRAHRFGPLIATNSLPALVALGLVWPLAALWGDWRVMLGSILVQAGLGTAVSHLVAERRWHLAWDRAILAGSMRFGWPLLINAGLMFLVFQGDKLIVGRVLGMEALALFAMGVTLTLTPTLVFTRTAQNLFLPRLSRIEAGFAARAQPVMRLHFLAGAALVLGTALAGPWVVHLALGAKFAGLIPMLVPLAALSAVRLFKGGPSTVALARGQTENPMVANAIRAAFLPLGYWVAVTTGRIDLIILLALLAEGLGLIAALALVWSRAGVALRGHGLSLILNGLAVAAPLILPGWSGLALSAALLTLGLIEFRAANRSRGRREGLAG